MKGFGTRQLERMVLVSTPWPSYNRPSIQLGALKAYLKSQFPELKLHVLHLYLKVAERLGYRLYRAISERTWLSEPVFGALLFPERKGKIEKVFHREARAKTDLRGVDFEVLLAQVEDISDTLITSVDWGRYELAGLSVCLCQLTSSLYFVKRIKEGFPHLPVVVGGSAFSGDGADVLLETFPEVDFVVHGEGELPLCTLVRHMTGSYGKEGIPSIPGIVARKERNARAPKGFHQLQDLSSLPPPDYDEYFHLIKTLDKGKMFFPTLPTEVSRGCWWRTAKGSRRKRGCAFCNLNLQWEGYRTKTVSQVISEIDYLTTRYQTLSVAFMDNVLPLREAGQIFSRLGKLPKDFRLFAEIRATTPYKLFQVMASAGMQEVQVGIEALSTSLLRKLRKGTTAIQNMEVMKHCEALGISNISNLILHFPGSDANDVDETLHALEFALPFRPLRFVHFWLGLGSPVWQHPRAYGLKAVFNHPNYAALFPSDFCRTVRFMIQSYRGDLGHQRRLWQPVKKKVRAWKTAYAELHQGHPCSPILTFRDGQKFLIIRQRRFRAAPVTHRLTGASRAIYLYCQRHRSAKGIVARFPNVSEDKIMPFLKMMVDKRLMFEEHGRYLSLAVPVRTNKQGG